MGWYRENAKENGNYCLWGYVRIMETKMETTIYGGNQGIMENKMETTIYGMILG